MDKQHKPEIHKALNALDRLRNDALGYRDVRPVEEIDDDVDSTRGALLARDEALERANDVGAVCLDRSKEMNQSDMYGRGFSDAMEECRERLRKALGRD